MTQAVVGEIYRDYLHLFEINGTTPLPGKVDGDFGKLLAKDGVVSALPVVVSEVGSGVYMTTFTPDSPARWMLRVDYLDGANSQFFAGSVNVGGLGEAMLNAALDDVAAVLHMDVWLERDGSLVLAPASCSIEVFDDTGTSLFTEVSAAPQADGRFALTNTITLAGDRTYSAVVKVTDSRGEVVTGQAFSTVT